VLKPFLWNIAYDYVLRIKQWRPGCSIVDLWAPMTLWFCVLVCRDSAVLYEYIYRLRYQEEFLSLEVAAEDGGGPLSWQETS